MKIALCFYGLIGSKEKKYGKGKLLDPNISYKYYEEHFLSNNHEIDIFIHSQSFRSKDEIVKIYKPKKYHIEKQKSFFLKTLFHKKIIIKILSLLVSFCKREKKIEDLFEEFNFTFNRCKNLWSRWYSTKKVIDLKKEYEFKKNFKYDLVMLTRLDMAFFSKFEFEKIPKNLLTVPNHNDVGGPRNEYKTQIVKNNRTYEKGISDFWFISSSENIDIFSDLYKHFRNYNISSHTSSYEHSKNSNLELNFYKYRGIDHEAIRRLNLSDE